MDTGQWGSFGGTLFKAVPVLLSQNPCPDSAPHALHEFDQTTRRSIWPLVKWERGHDTTPTRPIGLNVEGVVVSAEINANLICPLRKPRFRLGTLIHPDETQFHWKNEQMYDQQTSCWGYHHRSLALDNYFHVEPVGHDVVIHTESMSCLQAI